MKQTDRYRGEIRINLYGLAHTALFCYFPMRRPTILRRRYILLRRTAEDSRGVADHNLPKARLFVAAHQSRLINIGRVIPVRPFLKSPREGIVCHDNKCGPQGVLVIGILGMLQVKFEPIIGR